MNGAASDVLPRGYRNKDIMFDINLYSKKRPLKATRSTSQTGDVETCTERSNDSEVLRILSCHNRSIKSEHLK